MAKGTRTAPPPVAAEAEKDDLGQRLRAQRLQRQVSLRELARRVGISASAISQIETGRSRPSVSTLYAIVSELGISLDELFAPTFTPLGDVAPDASPNGTPLEKARPQGPIQTVDSRKVLQLETGVQWQRLSPSPDPEVDFLEVTYPVGGSSCPEDRLIRHAGREYGVVLSGRLGVTIGFDEYELGPSDSIVFDSAHPHRLRTLGDEPARAIWFVIGRRQSDERLAQATSEAEPLS